MSIRRWRYVLPLLAASVLVVTAAAGCTGAETPSQPAGGPPTPVVGGTGPSPGSPEGFPPTPTGTPAGQPPSAGGSEVTIVRSGGFAGVWQSVTAGTDGKWTFHNQPNSRDAQNGTLTVGQRTKLRSLLADPALTAEARQRPGSPNCADGFSYTLTTGALTVSWLDCGSSPKTAGAVVQLLADTTPF